MPSPSLLALFISLFIISAFSTTAGAVAAAFLVGFLVAMSCVVFVMIAGLPRAEGFLEKRRASYVKEMALISGHSVAEVRIPLNRFRRRRIVIFSATTFVNDLVPSPFLMNSIR